MFKLEISDPPRPSVIRHAAAAGEKEQARRIFERNAILTQLHSDDRRAAYAAMTSQAPFAPDVSAKPVKEDGVRGWWLRPVGAARDCGIFFVHGGGYHLGDASSYLGFVSQIATLTRRAVFSVDYALAPESRFPTAFEEVLKARSWFLSLGLRQYAAMGDSAGGGLVLAVTDQAPSDPRLASIVLFSPWTDLSNSGAAFRDPATVDPIFSPDVLEGLAASYLNGASPTDRRASPLFGQLEALPPTNIQVGRDELLLDDSVRFANLAASRGANVRLDVFEGMYHVFQRDVGVLKTAQTALEIAAGFVEQQWSNEAAGDRS